MPSDKLSDLLLRWEELRDQGLEPAAEDLCGDCPELHAELQQQIASLRSIDALLGTAPGTSHADGHPATDTVPTEPLVTQLSFRALGLHARGGRGDVLLAEEERTGRRLAVKRIQALYAHDPTSRRRFVREAEITSRLEHPGIVPVYAISEDDAGRPFYAMRMIEGQTLDEAIRQLHASAAAGDTQTRRTSRQLLARFISVCNTVAYAHSRGIIHRDLKPANILLGRYGETLIADWGLAKPLNAGAEDLSAPVPRPSDNSQTSAADPTDELHAPSDSTRSGTVMGTPAYMSPEQAAGRVEEVGPASDIFALGATLYSILTGQAPFGGNGGAATVLAQSCRFPAPRQRNRDVPRPLDAICLRAMARQPQARYASALDLAADLEHWLADEPTDVYRENWIERLGRWSRKHRAWTRAAAAALMLIAFVAVAAATLVNHQRQLAVAAEAEAHQQRNLSLDAYGTLVSTVQREMQDKPALQGIKQQLLSTALIGLRRVSRRPSNARLVDSALAAAHLQMADILNHLAAPGSEQEARREYQTALQILQQLDAEGPYVEDLERHFYLAHLGLGDLERRRDMRDGARQHYQRALSYLQRRLEAPDVPDGVYVDLCTVYENLADVSDDAAATLDYLQKATDALAAVPDDGPLGRDKRRFLGGLYLHRALAQRDFDPPQCRPLLESALEINQSLVQDDPTSVLARLWVAWTCSELADVCYQFGDTQQARAHALRAIQLLETLAAEDPQDLSAKRSLLSPYLTLGDVQRDGQDWISARQSYDKVLQLGEALLADRQFVFEMSVWCAYCCHEIGSRELGDGRFDEARSWFERGRRHWQRLQATAPARIHGRPWTPDFERQIALCERGAPK